MLILVMMLLIGLFIGIWGFMMCFFPAQWNRLTEVISFADRWSDPSPKRLNSIIKLGHCAAGLVIFAVGCWFTFVAASEIYVVFAGKAGTHFPTLSSAGVGNSPRTVGNIFSVLVIATGIAMAVVPVRMLRVFENIWPAGRSVRLSAPNIKLFIRVLGGLFALIAIMFLIR